jgi:hypothetical protein
MWIYIYVFVFITVYGLAFLWDCINDKDLN